MRLYYIKPQKTVTHITRISVGGNLPDYPSKFTTPTEYITTDKTLINITISTPEAIVLCADISKFYLNTPINHYVYMQLKF